MSDQCSMRYFSSPLFIRYFIHYFFGIDRMIMLGNVILIKDILLQQLSNLHLL